ncbi:MAG: lipopolysaccharide export system permease protein [Chlamydiales bacterium]|jgi:lipopolysaccharide export system permease protein
MSRQPVQPNLRDTGRRQLRPVGRLDRYTARLFVTSYSTALLLVVGLFWVLDLAAHIDDFFEPWPDGTMVDSKLILRYHLLNLPYLFLQVAPFVTLVAGMFSVNRLLKANEVVAVLGAGVSAHRLLMPVFAGGLLAALGMFGVREWASNSIADPRDALLDVLENHRYEREYHNLWLRDLDGNNLRLGSFHPGDADGHGAHVEDFEAIIRDGASTKTILAPRADWRSDTWLLTGGVTRTVSEALEVGELHSLEGVVFTPKQALTYRRARDNPLELSFSEVRRLMRRDPDNVVYQTLWQYHLTFPLANLVLLLVAIPVMLGFERGRGSERMALGMGMALFYFATDFVCRTMGIQGALSPVISSWLPVLLFGSVGVVLFDSMRT